MKNSEKRIEILIAAMLFAAGAFAARADDNAPSDVTYARDIAPLFNKNCVECHRPGQIGPMSLLNYQETRPWAKSIKKAVTERTMPPWFADPAYGKFSNDCTLKAEDVAKVAAWVDQGAPAGNLAEAPAPPVFSDSGYRFGTPDKVFQMKPYKVDDDVEDHYEHVLIENDLDADKWVYGAEVKPGLAQMVHHVLVFLIPKGLESSGGLEPQTMMKSTFFTGWAPGTNPLKYKGGFGKVIPKDCNILFQVHYHKTPGAGTGGMDASSLALKFADKPIENPTTTAWIMDPTIRIPAGDNNYESVSQFKFMDDGWILGMVPHMHLRGKNFKFEALYPDGRTETLLYVPNYDFNWQIAYTYGQALRIPKGTTIRATAHWDNSAANPNNPNPNVDVYFSERTTDEMMIGFMEYAYENRKNSQARFGFPEGMKGFNGFGAFSDAGAGEDGKNLRAEMMAKMKKRRSIHSDIPQGQ